ncbi:hypothetical protein [Ideonella sp. BN130291]|uniref:hypothetical protein n=1 Tax=Ideonella sp. BN130291 TaxID=3112940 RepID=UPI002E2664B1|nr:hypothetical protein [Ideonella sp. BN130291]
MRPRHDAPRPADAARAGVRWLLAQAALGFPDAVHVMRFPRAGGLLPGTVEHRGASFAQAVLGALLLDVADALPSSDAASAAGLRAAAARLADAVAQARLPALAGGWRYFPGLAALPPDLDSLAVALSLFARVAPEHLTACEPALALALAQQQPEGPVPTWLIGAQDPLLQRWWMRLGVRHGWGDTIDVDVCARFASALDLLHTPQASEAAARLAAWVAQQQRPDGRWPASWYAGDAVAAGLALAAVAAVDHDGERRARTAAHLLGTQRMDGGWGPFDDSAPLDTAVAVALLRHAPQADTARARGLAYLCDRQTLAGGWKATPWIRMDIGRAQGRVARIATWGCAAISTAACVRTLLQVSAADAAQASEVTWMTPPPVGKPPCGCAGRRHAGRGCKGCRGCKEAAA